MILCLQLENCSSNDKETPSIAALLRKSIFWVKIVLMNNLLIKLNNLTSLIDSMLMTLFELTQSLNQFEILSGTCKLNQPLYLTKERSSIAQYLIRYNIKPNHILLAKIFFISYWKVILCKQFKT